MKILLFILVYLALSITNVFAGKANVLKVEIYESSDGYYTVMVTVQHDDEGWDHYADRWVILDMDGNSIAKRILAHPHSPTPFTRAQHKVTFAKGMKKIHIRAHDSIHGFGGKEMVVPIPDK